MKMINIGRTAKKLVAAALVLTLGACLLVPGKFASSLDVRKSGDFSFTYTGELIFLPLADKKSEPAKFEPNSCFGDDTNPAPGDDPYAVRDCTSEEVAQQKTQWEEGEASRIANERQQAESFSSMFGGINPDDDKAGEELAERLRRQAGWKRVDYKGKGVFDVDYAITGKLDHDFVFPTIERFAMANVFVQITRRNDGAVRIDAPGFGPPSSPMGMGGMMGGGGNPLGGEGSSKSEQPPMDGSFALRTDATILANNTDEGPKADPAGQRLDWQINPRSPAAPSALLRLTQ